MSTVARSHPSVAAAWRWERRKTRSMWFYVVVAAVSALGFALGVAQYHRYQSEFESQHVTWTALWGQATMLPTMFFIPLAIAAAVAQTSAGEHQGRNWPRMTANGLDGAMFRGKLLHTLQLSFIANVIFVGEFVVAGLALLGFPLDGLGPFLLRLVPMTLSLWAISLAVMWLGLRMTSFAAVMTSVLIGIMAGVALTIVSPLVAAIYPMSLLTSACSSRNPANVASMGAGLAATAIALVWVAVLSGMSWRRMKRLS